MMPSLPGGSCRVPGCPLAAKQSQNGYCDKHKNKGWSDFQRDKGNVTRVYQTSFWKKQRTAAIARDMGLCKNCARNNRISIGNEVDHIIPLSQGGTNEMSNLETLCKPCHAAKTALE